MKREILKWIRIRWQVSGIYSKIIERFKEIRNYINQFGFKIFKKKNKEWKWCEDKSDNIKFELKDIKRNLM